MSDQTLAQQDYVELRLTYALGCLIATSFLRSDRWAEAHEKIARMTLTIKLDRNWSSFQLANSTPPLSVTGSAIAPSARMHRRVALCVRRD